MIGDGQLMVGDCQLVGDVGDARGLFDLQFRQEDKYPTRPRNAP